MVYIQDAIKMVYLVFKRLSQEIFGVLPLYLPIQSHGFNPYNFCAYDHTTIARNTESTFFHLPLALFFHYLRIYKHQRFFHLRSLYDSHFLK